VILEKPIDVRDATRMLTALSGRTHTVVTAFAIASNENVIASDAIASRVTFRISRRMKSRATSRPANHSTRRAYGIQELAEVSSRMSMASRDNVMDCRR